MKTSNCSVLPLFAPRTEKANHERERVACAVPSQSARDHRENKGGGRALRCFSPFTCEVQWRHVALVGLRKSFGGDVESCHFFQRAAASASLLWLTLARLPPSKSALMIR